MRIQNIDAQEILDSRGNPTLRAAVTLEGGWTGEASVPSGASTGKFEAKELRDGDEDRYGGLGVTLAAGNINGVIRRALKGLEISHPWEVDERLIALDGTDTKSRLGANATLAVSLAAAKALAAGAGLPLYRLIGGHAARRTPVPMMNILNGGLHASNNVDIQEFMILPVGADSFSQGLRWCVQVYHALKRLLISRGLSCGVGDEGGFAPDLNGDEEALELIIQAVELAGFRLRQDFLLALDAAASGWRDGNLYRAPKGGKAYTAKELTAYWAGLCEKYPICSIEDGLDEEDWSGWQALTKLLGEKIQLVGDDLFVTNASRIRRGVREGCANAVLIKPNQIGTLMETVQAVRLAQDNGYRAILSHRSGETEDASIADLAVGLEAGQIKAGAPCRGERVAKYNRLLVIQRELGPWAVYGPGPGQH